MLIALDKECGGRNCTKTGLVRTGQLRRKPRVLARHDLDRGLSVAGSRPKWREFASIPPDSPFYLHGNSGEFH